MASVLTARRIKSALCVQDEIFFQLCAKSKGLAPDAATLSFISPLHLLFEVCLFQSMDFALLI